MAAIQREEVVQHLAMLRENMRQDKGEVLDAIKDVRDLVRVQNSRIGTLEVKVAAIEAEPNLRRDRMARVGAWVGILGLVGTWIAWLKGLLH